MKKTCIVTGASGFIGHHLCKKLLQNGNRVIAIDIDPWNKFTNVIYFTFFMQWDLTKESSWKSIISYLSDSKDVEIYQLACKMGGAGFIFTGNNDAEIMSESAMINLLCAQCARQNGWKVFLSSSACIYPSFNQTDPDNPNCEENSSYPANPDSEYGWEKLFSERLYLAFHRNYNLDIRIARLHNIFGPEGTFQGGKEKAPAAICRKVAQAKDGDTIEIWGPGKQTRSFLYIDECLEGIENLMNSNFTGPVNIGSEEMISINNLTKMIIKISGKKLNIKNIEGPVGVMGRNSCNKLIQEKLGWKPSRSLEDGIKMTYEWIQNQVI